MPTPEAFLNATTIYTFTGATAGVVAVGVLFRRAFGINSLAVPALASYLVTGVLAYTDGTYRTPVGLLVAFLNGAMLFCASVGMNESISERPAGRGEVQGTGPKRWLQSYFSR